MLECVQVADLYPKELWSLDCLDQDGEAAGSPFTWTKGSFDGSSSRGLCHII